MLLLSFLIINHRSYLNKILPTYTKRTNRISANSYAILEDNAQEDYKIIKKRINDSRSHSRSVIKNNEYDYYNVRAKPTPHEAKSEQKTQKMSVFKKWFKNIKSNTSKKVDKEEDSLTKSFVLPKIDKTDIIPKKIDFSAPSKFNNSYQQ